MMKKNKQKWLEARKTYLGGTDISAVIGVNPYRTALDVYLEKTSEDVMPQQDNEAMYWGRTLEDIVLKEYSKRTGVNVIPPMGTHHDIKHKFLACNIDGWVENGVILECKTAGARANDQWGEEGTDEIPEAYLCQVAWYCAITGAHRADIAVLIGGQDFRIYTYYANKDFQDKLIQAGVDFWQSHILKLCPPPATNTQDLIKVYGKSNEQSIEASPEILEKARNLKDMVVAKKSLEEDIKNIQFQIQDFMREYDVLTDNEGNTIVTWKNRKSSDKLDAKTLRKNFPEIYVQHLTESKSSRTFLIK